MSGISGGNVHLKAVRHVAEEWQLFVDAVCHVVVRHRHVIVVRLDSDEVTS